LADAKFFIKPSLGTQIEARVTMFDDEMTGIVGTLTDKEEKAVENAMCLLFSEEMSLLDRRFTDSDGQFLFGPLKADELYIIKIHKSDTAVRLLYVE
jgi:hypothetical protein